MPPEVTPAQLGLLGVIALALLFEHYDISMLTAAARDIRASFDIPQSDLGGLTALVRLGALPAVLLVPFADRIGRRRLFLVSVAGTSLATLLTAFSQSAAQFVAIQMLARTFLIAGSAVAFVIVAEEFPARHRGWAVGILGALGAVGFGLGALVFPLSDHLPYGWRALYVFGAIPLFLLPMFHRRVPETHRFTRSRDVRATGSWLLGWWRPFATLAKRYPGRSLALASIGSLAAAGHGMAHQLVGDFVLTDHGFTKGQYSTMVILGGAVGIIGNTAVGRFADRLGRRVVGFLILGLFPVFACAFYNVPTFWIPAVWIPMVFVTTGGNTVVRALSTELFPTSSRGTASGSLSLFETLGAASGLAAVSLLTAEGASYAPAASVIVFLTLIAGGVALMVPETARRELEDISDEE
ncbi:MAG: MFS transporter [Myxococcota bacterium]